MSQNIVCYPMISNVALQILGRKFYKNIKKKIYKYYLYPQSLLIFIHITPVVENHPTTRQIRDLLRPTSTLMGKFLHEQLAHLHKGNTQRKLQTYSPMKILWKIITRLLCYRI